MTNSKNLLLIFTRNPELGKCKTRLAATIGDHAALEVYKFLLQHTANITHGLNVHKKVYYSESIWKDDVWDEKVYEKKVQQGNNLGERMIQAFSEGFNNGFEKIIVIGSDMLDLSQSDIENAFTALDEDDFVIGPAEDGGYYLLGMKIFKPQLFQDKHWGKDTVFSDSMADLQTEKVNVLPIKNDIDVYEDIKDIDAFQPFLKQP
ncbi:TIGR04282 family arsenosugar biosynthesis glycosyltransferase [Ulvibacterium marinum]|uniref:TIGR04282 family arsenosugar biosynthesis glycosyltransferase n=1 Tax=Ulvibacterium marinum TaxID=2419782 RepID=UPI002493D399|nr:TIGR04282 family arsenosugar biosynthesis glycosyltransferase [Ulvibacterium marinum]